MLVKVVHASPPLHVAVQDGCSDHHMSDCDTPTAADHEMEHEGQDSGDGIPNGWSIESVPTDGYMAIDGDYTLWLVIDTNILIEDLEHLKEFHRGVTLAGSGGVFKDIRFNILYYIPKKVNAELCAHKERGLKKHQAREANRVLYDVLSRDKHGVQESDAIQREAEEAFPDVLRGPDVNSDDHIRLSAIYLQDRKSKATGKHAVVLLTGDVNLAIKGRASGITCRKLAGSAGTTIKNLPSTRPQLLKEFFPEVIVKTDKERRIEALKEKASYDPNLKLLAMHGLGQRRRSQPRSNSGGLSPHASGSTAGKAAPHLDSPGSSRSSMLDHFPGEASMDHHLQTENSLGRSSQEPVQRQSSLGRGLQGSGEPGVCSQPLSSHQAASQVAFQGEEGAVLSWDDVLDCIMSGMKLALQWHLQHRYPDIWEQEMGYMSTPERLLERLLSWPHVLDVFTTVQAEDERQIMAAIQQLKLFSNDTERGDLWRAVESGRVVLSSFSRPLSTVALSVSQPVDAEEAFAALREARRRMNKLYSQLAKDRPRAPAADPPKAGSASGYGSQRQAHNPRGLGDGTYNGQQYQTAPPTAAGAHHRPASHHPGATNGTDMQSPFLHQQHLQFHRVPGVAGPHAAGDAALLQGLSALEVSGRSGSGHSLQSQLSGRSFGRTDSMDRGFLRADSAQAQNPGNPARGHYSTRAGYQQQHPVSLPSVGMPDVEAALLLQQQAMAQAALMAAGRQPAQLSQLSQVRSGPGFAAGLGQNALANADWSAAMQTPAMQGLAPPAGSAHLPAGSNSTQQHLQPAQSSSMHPAGPAGVHVGGGAAGMQAGLEHSPSSPHPRAPGFKTQVLMRGAVEMLAGAQQWGAAEDMAARRLLQSLVLARRAAAFFPADMQDQAKLHTCLQALQGLWSLLLQSCQQDVVEPDFEDMLMYLSDASRLEGIAKHLLELTNKG